MERPLTGEPLAVDLVNTRWQTPGGELDLLATVPGLEQWLRECGLSAEPGERMRRALVQARAALQRAFEGAAGAEDEVSAILARAMIVRSLVDGQAHEQPVFADESWRPAWLAADDYLRLRVGGADSVRQCEHPSCVLYFYDPSGRRRWCSMAVCGNRVKAQRHYAKQQLAGSARGSQH